MKIIGLEKRRLNYARLCEYNLRVLSTLTKKYQENEKKLPQAMKEFIPRYLKDGLPVCPLSGKDYLYTVKDNGFTISCPNAREHGFKEFLYSTKDGFVYEPLDQEPEGDKSIKGQPGTLKSPPRGDKQFSPPGDKKAAPQGDKQAAPPKKNN
jgi:hypothetical protein